MLQPRRPQPDLSVPWNSHIFNLSCDIMKYIFWTLLHHSTTVTNYMKKSPSWEARRCSFSKDIHILWNLKVHYFVYKSLSLFPILRQTKLVLIFTPHLFKILFNIFLPSNSSKWSLPFRLPIQIFLIISHLFHAYYITHPSHPLQFDNLNNITWRIRVMISSQGSFH